MDGRLIDGDGTTFTFASVNVPNLARLELGTTLALAPSATEITDGLCSVQQMGGTVVRMYVLSHGNGGGFQVHTAPSLVHLYM